MKKVSLLCIGFLMGFALSSHAQSFTRAFDNASLGGKSDSTGVSTFLTMESVRHGMAGKLKGVEVSVLQPDSEGEWASIFLKNPTGEPWKYQIFTATGQIYAQGETGYERRVLISESGRYLIRFTHKNGLLAFDEVGINPSTKVEPGKENLVSGQKMPVKNTIAGNLTED